MANDSRVIKVLTDIVFISFFLKTNLQQMQSKYNYTSKNEIL